MNRLRTADVVGIVAATQFAIGILSFLVVECLRWFF